jgi:hypothetical protein
MHYKIARGTKHLSTSPVANRLLLTDDDKKTSDNKAGDGLMTVTQVLRAFWSVTMNCFCKG